MIVCCCPLLIVIERHLAEVQADAVESHRPSSLISGASEDGMSCRAPIGATEDLGGLSAHRCHLAAHPRFLFTTNVAGFTATSFLCQITARAWPSCTISSTGRLYSAIATDLAV